MLGSLFPTFLLAAAENDWLARWQETATVISPDDTWGLWGIILTGTALAIYLEQKFRWAAKVSGPVLALIAAMVMSNLKIMPTESEAYGLVSTYLVPIAIPLLLLRADAMRIIRETGWMFLAFHLSCLGTIIGAVVATIIFHGQIEQTPEIAGIMTGSYSGGSVNFFACRESFDVSEGLTNPLLVADNFIMAGMFAVLLVFSGSRFFLKRYSHAYSANTDKKSGDSLAAEYWSRKGVGLLDIAKALAIAVTIAALSTKLASLIATELDSPKPQHVHAKGTASPETVADAASSERPPRSTARSVAVAIVGNPFVWITLLSVLAATFFHRQMAEVGGAEDLGAYLLYVFFFTIGLPADLVTVVANVPLLFAFCVVIAVINLTVTLVLGRLFRLNLEELLICVNATLGGAPSAAAMAIAKGWRPLVLPALLVGLWGYVIGTFLGVAVGNILLAAF